MCEQINREEKLFVEKRKIGNNRESKLGLGGSVGGREQLRGICSTLSAFGGGERDNFEGTLPSQAANLDEVAQFLMYLSDVSSEQGLNAVEAVIHDGLVVSDVVQCVSVLDQDVLKLVGSFL